MSLIQTCNHMNVIMKIMFWCNATNVQKKKVEVHGNDKIKPLYCCHVQCKNYAKFSYCIWKVCFAAYFFIYRWWK